MKTKIIFLDIDGVLNSEQSCIYYNRRSNEGKSHTLECEFCPINMSNLNYIMENVSNTEIVISSTWRAFHKIAELQDILTKNGFLFADTIIGATPRLNVDRGLEIQSWIDAYGASEIEKFVIIDDNDDMMHLKDSLVQTDVAIGLTIKDADLIIKELK